MSVESLTYAALAERLGCSPEAARALAKRASEADRLRTGYGVVYAFGPRSLPVNPDVRVHYLGLDLLESA